MSAIETPGSDAPAPSASGRGDPAGSERHDQRPLVIVGLAALGLGTALWGLAPLSDYDLWWHLASGREMLARGSLLPADVLSYTAAGAPWDYKDAGAALLFYSLWTWIGPAALVLLKTTVLGLSLAALGGALGQRRLPPPLGLAVLAAALSAWGWRFIERPAIFSFAAAAAVLWLIERHRAGRRGLGWAVPLTVLAANLHRGALLLPLILAGHALIAWREHRSTAPAAGPRNRARLPGVVALASVPASVATPFGLASITTSWRVLAGDTYRGTIPEWQPITAAHVWAATPATIVLGLALAAGVALALLRRRRPGLWDIALAAGALAIAAAGLRFVAYSALFAAVPVGSLWAQEKLWRAPVGRGVALVALAAALFAAGSEGSLVGLASPLAPERFPEGGVAYLERARGAGFLRGHVLNDYGLGGYLEWTLGPEVPVYVDGRNELVFPPELIARQPRLFTDPALFAEEVKRWDVEWLFLHNRPDVGERAHLDGPKSRFALVFASEAALVYVRRDGPSGALAQGAYQILEPHRLLASAARAFAGDGSGGPAALEEARRMRREDPGSLPANVVLATTLGLAGKEGPELEAALDVLVARGYQVPTPP